MNTNTTSKSWLQAILSLFLPGLGQIIAGAFSRGFLILLSVFTFSGLTVYTAARRARFPDYGASFHIFLIFLAESFVLLLIITGLYRLAARRFGKDDFQRNITKGVFILFTFIIFGIAAAILLPTAIPAGKELQFYGGTALFTAGVVAALWLWNIYDAFIITPSKEPSSTAFVSLVILATLFLGTRLIQIDLSKAIREYKDTEVILSRLVWPWKAAFDYQSNELHASAKIEAPCDFPDQAPAVQEPGGESPWLSVTPTCGNISIRDKKGNLTYGDEITITGGGFAPGETVELKWENPIGNAFTPRGVGPTEITVGDDGTFTTKLYIPDVVIPAVAEGAQIHTLHAIQTSGQVFTGKLSNDIKLALQAMLETIMMGLMATFTGIILSIPLSFLAARNLMQSITTTTQGFVGGVIGLAFGGWAGKWLASVITPGFGGLEGAPIPTALTYFILILAGALLAYRYMAKALDSLAQRLPQKGAQAVGIFGMALIGAGIGYVLGTLYAKGVISITHGDAAAIAAIPSHARIGALLFGAIFVIWAFRLVKMDKLPVGMIIYTVVRLILNIIRSIEPLIWAIMGVIWIGPGPFAGFIALTIHSVAALGKLYSESIESINNGPIEALQAAGANRLQTIIYAVVPQVLPPFTSFTLYRWDINVRMSTIIGMVGGGGIGFLLIQWIRQFQYMQAGMAVWLIAITVAALDFISASIREKMV